MEGTAVVFNVLPDRLRVVRLTGADPDPQNGADAGKDGGAQGDPNAGNGGNAGAQGDPNAGAGNDGAQGDDDGDDGADDVSALRAQLKERDTKIENMERASRSDAENLKRDLDKFKKIADEFDEFKQTTYLELQVLRTSGKDSKVEWNPQAIEDVCRSVNLDKLTFNGDGGKITSIDGLDAELKRIAKEKPYLLAAQKDSGNEGNPSGQGGSGSGGKGGKSATDAELMSKYKIA